MNPHSHRCDERTIDYSRADRGVITCGCGRRWDLAYDEHGRPTRWEPTPLTRTKP